VEIGDERTELVAQHALRQTECAGGIVGAGGFTIPLEIGEIGAQVEPGKRVLRIVLRLLLGRFQRVLAVEIVIPIIAQDALDDRFHVRRVHHDIHAVE